MKLKPIKKLAAILFTFCMALLLVPIQVFAAEGDTEITEVNINNVSNELWSFRDVPFATVDESSNYTIESQEWYLSETEKITPTSENLKPTAGKEYTFNITLKAKEDYIFPSKSSEAKIFYSGSFKINGNVCDNLTTKLSDDNKTLTATLFPLTKVKGVTDNPRVTVKTTVRDNYTDCQITDDIDLKEGSDYIIDFTKEDNLSKALISMADLEETKYYKFANSDNNSLIETENTSEALIKIVGNKSENKAIMTLLRNINENISYTLKFMRTYYTGTKFTYVETAYDEGTGKTTIEEIRDDYYTRYHFNCKLNLIADSKAKPQPPGSTSSNNSYKIIEGENSSWIKNTDGTLTFRANGDFSEFLGIKVDGSWIDSENYIAGSGSTVVTLKNEYLKTLSEDKHEITFVYKNGECSTSFEVKKPSEEICENSDTTNAEGKEEQNENSLNPRTGDNNMLLWASLLSVSITGMLEITIYDRKKILINL